MSILRSALRDSWTLATQFCLVALLTLPVIGILISVFDPRLRFSPYLVFVMFIPFLGVTRPSVFNRVIRFLNGDTVLRDVSEEFLLGMDTLLEEVLIELRRRGGDINKVGLSMRYREKTSGAWPELDVVISCLKQDLHYAHVACDLHAAIEARALPKVRGKARRRRALFRLSMGPGTLFRERDHSALSHHARLKKLQGFMASPVASSICDHIRIETPSAPLR